MGVLAGMGAASLRAMGFGLGPLGLKVQDVFAVSLYTGNGGTQAISNGLDLAGQGGLVWLKNRDGTAANTDNNLVDTVRGTSSQLISNSTTAANATSMLGSFDTNGFSLGAFGPNGGGSTYVGWSFRKAAKFFDVVTWTGDGTDYRTIPHSLGITPGMVIIRKISTTQDWFVWHRSVGATAHLQSPAYVLFLNQTTAQSSYPQRFDPPPDASSFGLGGYSAGATEFNAPATTYIAYLFAHDPDTTNGIIQCGSFVATSSAATVTLGWEPQLLLMKTSSTTGDWIVLDQTRGWGASTDNYLAANASAAEYTAGNYGAPSSTGFTAASLAGGTPTYIYMAIRKGPM